MTVSGSITNSLLESGSGFIFQTLFADLLTLGITAYVITAVIVPRLKSWKSFRNVASEIGIPSGHWFFGHAQKYGYMHEGLMNTIERCKEFPAMCTHYMGFYGAIQMYHPDVVKTLLTHSHPKSFFYVRFVKTALNEGLITSHGSLWKRHRRLLTPIFHFEILKAYTKIFNKNCKEFLDACSDFSQTGKPCDVTQSVSNLTFNNMMECVMSQKAQHESGKNVPYIEGVKAFSTELVYRFSRPLLWIDFIYNRSESGRIFNKAIRTVHDEAAKIIKERRQLLETLTTTYDNESEESVVTNDQTGQPSAFRKRKGKHLDFLDVLLQARDEDGVGLSDAEINDEVITFFSAGQETVATALTWILYHLSTHQEYQERCRQEIEDALGDKEEYDQSDLSKLTYITQCIKESMRVRPPIFQIGRSLSKDVVFSFPTNDGKKKIVLPKGTPTAVSIIALHQNPYIWKDPEVYDPERFNSENIDKIPAFAYIPFSAGPRNCLGQSFGMIQMKVFLAQVLRRYEFHYGADTSHPKITMGVTARPENGLHLIVKEVASKK